MSPAQASTLPSSRVDKAKSPIVSSKSTSVPFSLSSNFMIDDTVDKSKISPIVSSKSTSVSFLVSVSCMTIFLVDYFY